ncbi:hypothetical protein [Flagellimonas pacifica]|uniref:Uncharacterized protein n=1 Tax=Flagellimonas pacifica TaxID=1247520 RepID=A0A285MW10_9FLAO|nr:hypothetical protein [Allomuricauda parva]SNZ01298.1 hypothetical protein SAMN06265377_3136 [Allomuricauda parva]
MDDSDKVSVDFKKGFNLGYELAKELDLKVPMFKNQNNQRASSNAIQAGMIQYIGELDLTLNKNIDRSAKQRKISMDKKNRGKGKNTGKGLVP